MAEESTALRSRRALLAAAAGGAAALAASAALPLTAAAHDADDVQAGAGNPTTAATTITNATDDLTAFGASAAARGFGLEGSSATGPGAVGWSVTASTATLDDLRQTGVYGFSPTSADPDLVGVGVWGDSGDWGVLGTGSVGVYGIGSVGVWGASTGTDAGVIASGSTTSSLALDVYGKVRFSRSGKATVAKNKSSVKVTLAGVTTSSRVFAVLYSNRSGRYVRAAVPTSGSFTIYLNSTVSSTTYVSWFVLN